MAQLQRTQMDEGASARSRVTGASDPSHRRYPSLDLLRAAAIVLVVHCHTASGFAGPPLSTVLKLGGKGVELFFVLSGWLLGRQLMLELQRDGQIDLMRFWLRRWLRTLPAYYAVLVVISVYLVVSGGPSLRPSYLFFGQTYLTNMPYFGITWSLCVEEHFYLLVAPAILLFSRFPRVRWLIPVLLFAPSVCRTMGWFGAEYQTHVWYDACAMGVLLAVGSVAFPQYWRRMAPAARWVAAATMVIVGRDVALAWHPEWRPTGGLLAVQSGILTYAVVFTSWLWFAAVSPEWRLGRLRVVQYIAERSYAIYLLHLEVLAALRHFPEMPFLLTVVLVWLGSVIVAEVLFRTVERPGMRLRDHFWATRRPAVSI